MEKLKKLNFSIEEFKEKYWFSQEIKIPLIFKRFNEEITEIDFFNKIIFSIFNAADLLINQKMSYFLDKELSYEEIERIIGEKRINNFKQAVYVEFKNRLASNKWPEFSSEQNLLSSNFSVVGSGRDFSALNSFLTPEAIAFLSVPDWSFINLNIDYDKDDIQEKTNIMVMLNEINSIKTNTENTIEPIKRDIKTQHAKNQEYDNKFKELETFKNLTSSIWADNTRKNQEYDNKFKELETFKNLTSSIWTDNTRINQRLTALDQKDLDYGGSIEALETTVKEIENTVREQRDKSSQLEALETTIEEIKSTVREQGEKASQLEAFKNNVSQDSYFLNKVQNNRLDLGNITISGKNGVNNSSLFFNKNNKKYELYNDGRSFGFYDKSSNMQIMRIENDRQVIFYNNLQMNNNKITNLANPLENNHAATKKYVDDKISSEIARINIPRPSTSSSINSSEINALKSKDINLSKIIINFIVKLTKNNENKLNLNFMKVGYWPHEDGEIKVGEIRTLKEKEICILEILDYDYIDYDTPGASGDYTRSYQFKYIEL
ncbi:hypothetical protein [Mycoplasma tauri]|uniref:hypothetical protein n=1 Tax=Mycoplasma tauri TaxID=547987 RepID=UPI001CBF59BB|nr:hypothetical protein [Mycoplasma tauri]MBZ4203404.1 hypothetical protein [Mycoplasma tauri]